jgi:hypothetical protein
MRADLFARRRLNASYRNVPADVIVALLQGADDDDDLDLEAYFRAPRRRMKKEDR